LSPLPNEPSLESGDDNVAVSEPLYYSFRIEVSTVGEDGIQVRQYIV
jgi:hypothetical protein